LQARGILPQRLVHVWGWGRAGADDAAHGDAGFGPCFDSVLYLARALDRQALSHAVEFPVIADHMRGLPGATLLVPGKTALLGLLAAMPHELPPIACRAIDIPSPGSGAWQQRGLLSQIVHELHAPVTDHIIALRAGQRWVPDLPPVRLEAPDGQ